jgi:hypothetical protein
MCGQLLIISFFVPLFNFEVPLKIYKKRYSKKKNRKKRKEEKKWALCVFYFLFYGGAL